MFFDKFPDKNSFNALGVLRSFANLHILIIVYCFIFIPTTILGYTPLLSVYLVSFLVNTANALYSGNENQTLIIALNRFCALYFPFQYSKIFGMKQTLILSFLLYAYRIGEVILPILSATYSENDCVLYFSPRYLSWTTFGERCDLFGNAIVLSLIVFGMTTFVNIVTFAKVAYFFRSKFHHDEASRRREKKNINLFFQTVLQDFLYVFDLSFTFYFNGMIQHRLWTFLSGSLIWQLLHAIDGLIMVVFNEKFSLFNKCFCSNRREVEGNTPQVVEFKRRSISAALVTIN